MLSSLVSAKPQAYCSMPPAARWSGRRSGAKRGASYACCSSSYAGTMCLWSPASDRLARSLKDLQDIVHELKAKGVVLKATEQPIDTGTAAGKAFLDMLGVFAEFETNLRRERQLEGIQAAKARGVYKGRRPVIDPGEVRRLRDEERLGPSAIAKRLGIGRASVYRVLGGKAREA